MCLTHTLFCDVLSGDVISIHSSNQLEEIFTAASKLSMLVILYFTATWCGPCRFMGPVYKILSEQHRNVVFLKLHIDELGNFTDILQTPKIITFCIAPCGVAILGSEPLCCEKLL